MQSPILTNLLDHFLQQPNIEASPSWDLRGDKEPKELPV